MEHHDAAEIRECAAWLRGTLGLDDLDPPRPAGSRPLFVGMDPEPPTKKARVPIPHGSLAHLPLEIVRMIFVETLFPHGMLHLNQIRALGGGETRTRPEFEGALVQQFKAHRTAYTRLWFVFPEYRPMLDEPGFRTLLYRKWLAISPEGLYQKPEPSLAIPPDERRTLQIPAYPGTDTGTGLLSKWWYTDFLATIMYNEWQRAVSMTIARGLQILFALKARVDLSETSEAFRDYWAPRLTKPLREYRATDILDRVGDFSLARGEVAFYSLGEDLEYQRGHATHDPLLSGMRVLNALWLGYQSFEQPCAEYVKPLEGPDTTPFSRDKPNEEIIPFSVEAMWKVMRHRRIEILRVFRFSNTIRMKKMRERSPGLSIVVGATRESIRDYTDFQYRPLLIVERPHDMLCIPGRPQLFHAPGGFRPWAEDQRAFLTGFNWRIMHGMRPALEQATSVEAEHDTPRFYFVKLDEKALLRAVDDLDALMERLQTMPPKKALSYRPWKMN